MRSLRFGARLIILLALAGLATPAAADGHTRPFELVWQTEIADLLEIDVRDDTLWALRREPAAMVRFDEAGAIAETVAVEHPHGFHIDNEYDRPLSLIAGGGFFLGRFRFSADGRVAAELPFKQAYDLAQKPGGGLLRLTTAGIFDYSPAGEQRARWSGAGEAPGRLLNPQAFTVTGDGNVITAERKRVQVFDRQGTWLRGIRLPPSVGWPDRHTLIRDIAVDRAGFVYVAIVNRPAVVLLDPQLRHLAALPIHAEQVRVDRAGLLYTRNRKKIAVYRPTGEGVAGIERPTGPDEQSIPIEPDDGSRKRVAVTPRAVDASLVRAPAPAWRIHAATRNVSRVRVDPADPEIVWLATRGGVQRWDRRADRWETWSTAEGLEQNYTIDLWPQGKRLWIVQNNYLAVLENGKLSRLKLEGDGVRMDQARRVEADPVAAGRVWWFAANGIFRHDMDAGVWTYIRSPGSMRDGQVTENGPVILAQDAVWRFDAAANEWEELISMDRLSDAAADRPHPGSRLHVHKLTVEPGGNRMWIGTWVNGFFRIDLSEDDVRWMSPRSPDCCKAWCSESRVIRTGDRRLVLGRSCLGELNEAADGPAAESLVPDFEAEVHDAVPDPTAPGRLLMATDQGLAYFDTESNRFELQRSPDSRPAGSSFYSVVAAGGKLWAGGTSAELSALDLGTGRWESFSEICSVQRLSRSRHDGRLLATGVQCPGSGTRTAFVDPGGATVRVDDSWSEQLSMLYDAVATPSGLWALGKLSDLRTDALVDVSGSRSFLEGKRGFVGPHQIAVDPLDAGRLWVVDSARRLVRLDMASGENEVVREQVKQFRIAGDRILWILGSGSGRIDLETGLYEPIRGVRFADPDRADRYWTVGAEGLAYRKVGQDEPIAVVDVPRQKLYYEPVVVGDRAFIPSSLGLIEAPLRPAP